MNEEHKRLLSHANRLREDGNLEAARDMVLHLSNVEPESAAVPYVLGHIYSDMHQWEKAIAALTRAVEMRPASEATSLGLFQCLWEQGKYYEALEEVKRFISFGECANYRAIVAEINAKWRDEKYRAIVAEIKAIWGDEKS